MNIILEGASRNLHKLFNINKVLRKYKTYCFIIILLLCKITLFAETITIVADLWFPVNGIPESLLPGYAIEITEIIFKEAGYDFDYQIIPWSRALKKVQNGDFTVVIGATTENSPNLLIPEEPFGILDNDYYTVKENNWIYSGPDSLKSQYLGIIYGYIYGDIQQYINSVSDGIAVQKVGGPKPLFLNLKKLLSNRISVLVDWKPVIISTAKKYNFYENIRHAGSGGNKKPLFPGFTPGRSDLAEIWDNGIRKLKASGIFEEILQKYDLTYNDIGFSK